MLRYNGWNEKSIFWERQMLRNRFAVILSRPENPENIGLVARSMRNTGFDDLRLVGIQHLEAKTYVTAVHARVVLERARFYSKVSDAMENLDIIFAATAKRRKEFSVLPLEEALDKMSDFPDTARIGLLFGNERTGLTSDELLHSNFRFKIPQTGKQPPYNLASAVLITLFCIFSKRESDSDTVYGKPLSRKEQEACIHRILVILEEKGFSHKTNKKHVESMIFNLFGRLTITAEDRNLLLALFSKGTQ